MYDTELIYEADADADPELPGYAEWSAAVEQQWHEEFVIECQCDICGARGRGSEKQLVTESWVLSAAGEYCPSH